MTRNRDKQVTKNVIQIYKWSIHGGILSGSFAKIPTPEERPFLAWGHLYFFLSKLSFQAAVGSVPSFDELTGGGYNSV